MTRNADSSWAERGEIVPGDQDWGQQHAGRKTNQKNEDTFWKLYAGYPAKAGFCRLYEIQRAKAQSWIDPSWQN